MPYKVGNKRKKGYPILKKDSKSWRVVGYSKSKTKAMASVRARYAAESKGYI